MTLFQIVSILKQIALAQPNVQTATDGSVYDVMNTNPSVKYDVVHLTQTKHIGDEETDTYGFNIFYISRLEDSLEDNRLQIQSIGKEVLDNILRTFCENWGIDFPDIIYYPFTQKFTDLCAGVYCRVEIEVPREIICADDFITEVIPSDKNIRLQDVSVTITENGTRVITPAAGFDGIGEITITTDVPGVGRLQDKEVEYDTNGEYTVRPNDDFDGLASVAVSVNVPSRYDEGYDDGYDDGEADQKAKLVATTLTANDTYERADGWSAVTVNVPATPDRYDEGYADGEAAQKAKLQTLSVTANGEYNRADGYSAITVDVPSDYQEGFDDGFRNGEISQRSKLEDLTVRENGTYYREDGYATVYVDVPDSGDADLIANLQGDYYVIPYGTTNLRPYAFYGTCFSSITIPNTVTLIEDYSFATNRCLESIVIPDSVTGMGSDAFFACTSLSSATIGSGLTSIPDHTFYGCRALTGITIPSGITSVGYGSFASCSGLTEMTFEGLTPPTLADSGSTDTSASLGSRGYTFPIYVPCQALDAYKTAFGQYYSPRIQCKEQPVPTGATAITLNVASAITDSGTATTTFSPGSATTDIYYTCSDPTKATINSGTGVITVVSGGNVTICAIDRLSGLQDCKTVAVSKTHQGDYVTAIYNVVTLTGATNILGGTTGLTGSFSAAQLDDGTEVPIAKTFVFPKAGLNTVKFYIAKTKFDDFTFEGCERLVSVTIPNSVRSIGDEGCFYCCSRLTAVTLPNGITNLGDRTFVDNWSLSSITIPNSVKTIGEACLSGCKTLTALTIPSAVTSIHKSAFQRCYMFQSNFHNNSSLVPSQSTNGRWSLTILTSQREDGLCLQGTVVVNCRSWATGVTMPNTVTEIGDWAFVNCLYITDSSNIVWSTGVTTIGEYAFANVLFTAITIPDSVQTIKMDAFFNSKLKIVDIGTGIRAIYQTAFGLGKKITKMTIRAVSPPYLYGTTPLGSTSNTWGIYVPGHSVPYYRTGTGWADYADRLRDIIE